MKTAASKKKVTKKKATRKAKVPGLGARVKAARETLGLNQAELARRVGVEPSVIQRFEAGTTTPAAAVLIPLARALETTTDHLLTGAISTGSKVIRRAELPPEWAELSLSVTKDGVVVVVT